MSAPISMEPKVLISEAKIADRIKELARAINQTYAGQEIIAICVLKGSFIFFTDLIRELEIPVVCEFLGVSSYGNQTVTSGEVKMTLDLNEPIEDRHVLIFEDIVDSGLTLKYLQNTLRARRPASLRTCALLMKPSKLKTQVEVEYVGFTIGDEFVVGYGMDYAEKFRGLPYVGYLEIQH